MPAPIQQILLSLTSGAPLDGLANVTGAWSFGRKLLTSYSGTLADLVSTTTTLYNQQGTTLRNMAQTSTRNPTLTTGGTNSRGCGVFDGVNDCLIGQSGCALSALMSNSAGYVIISGIFDALTLNVSGSTADRNHRILIDTLDDMGLMGRSGGIAYGYNFDTNADYAISASSTLVAGTAYVMEWYHDSGNVGLSVNGATDITAASGNTGSAAGLLSIGGLNSGTGAFTGKIFDVAAFSALPSSTIRSALVSNFRTWCGA